MPCVVVAALYKFAPLDDFETLRDPLLACCESNGVRGSLLLATEGINGTIAGSRAGVDEVLGHLKSDVRLADLSHKESYTDTMPFLRMKVRLKKEIVTLGVPGTDPLKVVGTYVKPKDWNALIDDPEVVLVDTRNKYEYRLGSFKNALDPETDDFREFPKYVAEHLDPKKHKRVATFCTGGIRCEKATSFMLDQGFEEVYHLEGGILKYLEEVPEAESRWEGECFVFDERVAVNHDLAPGVHSLCRGCREPLSPEEVASSLCEEGICCPYCAKDLTPELRRGREERHKQELLARARDEKHVGREEEIHHEGHKEHKG